MKKSAMYILLALFAILVGYFFLYRSEYNLNKQSTVVTVHSAKGIAKINAEVADTEYERSKGLMFRNKLEEDAGMLFLFPSQEYHAFWMANTKIALDIIWIASDKKVVYISENTPPCTQTGQLVAYCTTYKPQEKAKYVLEVNAGWVKENNVKIGDKVSF